MNIIFFSSVLFTVFCIERIIAALVCFLSRIIAGLRVIDLVLVSFNGRCRSNGHELPRLLPFEIFDLHSLGDPLREEVFEAFQEGQRLPNGHILKRVLLVDQFFGVFYLIDSEGGSLVHRLLDFFGDGHEVVLHA